MNTANDLHERPTGQVNLPRYRFGIGIGGAPWRTLHAIDLAVPRAPGWLAAGRTAEAFAVCDTSTLYMRRLGQFHADSPFLPAQQRCERCGWVVALQQGTVDKEIALHVGAAGGADDGLLDLIFTSILADLPPGIPGRVGHRSELLAHAARHRPTVVGCADCGRRRDPALVHGPVRICPQARLVCLSCTFTAGPWAGDHEGVSTGECEVSAPCSVLGALAQHYDLARGGR